MKTFRVLLVTGVMALSACTDDGGVSPRKAIVDTGALSAGVTVTIDGNLGSVSVPFTTAVPEGVSVAEFEDELDGAISLLITSSVTGMSADIVSGSLVDTTPAIAGEFTWEMAPDRLSVTLTFFNETSTGLSLHAGSTYVAQLSISTNEYVQRLSAMSFDTIANAN